MIKASAPGKILWLGGYAVLERPNVSLVTAVNARVHASVEKANEDRLEISQFGIRKKTTELSVSEKEKAKFVLASLHSVTSYLLSKGVKISPVSIKTESDPAFSIEGGKSGLGSSAAVTVATVAALLRFYRFEDRELVHKIAQYAHAVAQGKVGSGFDIAAATYGTIKYIRYTSSLININESTIAKIIDQKWDCEIESVEWPSEFRVIVGNFVGESASTSAMVKQVLAFKKEHPVEYAELIKKIDDADRMAIAALRTKNYKEFATYFNESRLITKKLGDLSGAAIEPPRATKLIEKVLEAGALGAKLPGAGGGDSICAICLDEKSERKTRELLAEEQRIRLLNVKIENKGFSVL